MTADEPQRTSGRLGVRLAACAVAVAALLPIALWSDSRSAVQGQAQRIWAVARVSAAGALVTGREVDQVRRPRTGVYCVHLDNPFVDLTRSVVLATPGQGADRELVIRTDSAPDGSCGGDRQTLTVRVWTGPGTAVDADFQLAVL